MFKGESDNLMHVKILLSKHFPHLIDYSSILCIIFNIGNLYLTKIHLKFSIFANYLPFSNKYILKIMANTIRIKKGLNINLAGEAKKEISSAPNGEM